MTKFVQRLGRSIKADEVFEAWTSADLGRMVRALPLKTNPIDRHFLLQSIVQATYKRRSDPNMRQLCVEIGRLHLSEFPALSQALAAEFDGPLPAVPSFKWLATTLAEGGHFDEGISVCEAADRLGLTDGTTGGYSGRAERLQSGRARKRGAPGGA